MSGDAAVDFWTRMASLERDRQQAFRVEARFAQDGRRATPIQIVLDDGTPQAVIGDELAALRDKVDPVSIATRHPDERDGEAWRNAFDAAREQRQLTLNQACRLVLGPVYVPERQVHAYNANHELRVRASDLAPWLPELAGEGDYEYSLSELYGLASSEASNDTTRRADSNRVALASIRALLGVRGSFDLTVHGTAVHVKVTPGDAARWPRVVEGLNEGTDGPWPPPLFLSCSWQGGQTTLRMGAETWGKNKDYYGVIGLYVRQESLALVWITVPREIWSASDDAIVNAAAALSLNRRGDVGKELNQAARKIVDIVKETGVPFASTKSAEAFRIHVPSGRVLPGPEEAVRRLTLIALAKQPFLSQASGSTEGVFDPGAVVGEVDLGDGVSKQDLLPPLPGGVRSDKDSLDKLAGWLAEGPRSEAELARYVLDEFDTDDATLVAGCQRMLLTLGFARAEGATLSITPAGLEYLTQRAPEALFALLDRHFVGMVETLLAIRTHAVNADIVAALRKLPGRAGEQAQINARRNWLLALGCTERTERGELLTPLGRRLLGEHENGAEVIIDADDEEDSPIDSPATPDAPVAPPGWHSDRLDLRSASVAGHLGTLTLPPALIDQACAALSAGKHLLFVGPPGTGKTELALCLARAAQTDGYCAGLFTSTASADWTTYETIGGYALQKDGGLSFRSGVFLRALEQWQWLLIDELNRADIDKAFGELMTVLSGKGSDTPYLGAGDRPIGIGPEPTRSHVMPKTFRVIATMNLWDKTSLFRLSYAVQRRFAIIHVGQPDAATYAHLLQQEATRSWLEPPLANTVTSRLVELFGPERLLRIRAVGPAIPLDMIRYMRRRQAEHVGMAEALAMYLLPQLEGIEPSRAEGLWGLLAAAVGSDADAEGYLRERFQEIFPLAELAQARA